jgi:hypothetical protein
MNNSKLWYKIVMQNGRISGHSKCFISDLLLSGILLSLGQSLNVGVRELLYDHAQHDYQE